MINPMTDNVELEEAADAINVEKYEALTLLLDENTPAGKAFKKVILDGYLKDEAVRLTSLLAKNGMQSHRGSIFEALAGVSNFEQYLDTIFILGAPSDADEYDKLEV